MEPRIRLDTGADTPRIIEAIHQTWLGKDPPDEEDAREVRDGFAYYYEHFPEYTSDKIAIAEVDGEIASFAGIIPFPVEKGSFSLKAGQLNPVGTRREFHSRGISSACIRFLCDHLKEQGHSLFFVCGVSWFYPKLGFYPTFDEYTATIPISSLQEAPARTRVRPFVMEDAEQFLSIYERTPDQNLFHLRRDLHWVQKKILRRDVLPIGTIHLDDVLVSEQGGAVTGYAFLEKGENSVSLQEFRALNRDGLLSLLKTVAEIGSSRGAGEVRIRHAVPGEMIYPLALDLGGKITVTHSRHLMLKILSVENLFTSMRELFQKRITCSAWAGKPFSLAIESHEEKVSLSSCGEGDLSVQPAIDATGILSIPDPALVHLFTGHRTLFQQIDAGDCPNFDEEDNSLLDVLFPRHCPYIYQVDIN